MNDIKRFGARIKLVESGCIEWQGSLSQRTGYGQFWADGTNVSAHRWIYRQVHGSIPEGFDIDHLCSNRACVHPQHLEAVTRQENVQRSHDRGRYPKLVAKDCKRGHPASAYVVHGNKRVCSICHSEGNKRWRERHPAYFHDWHIANRDAQLAKGAARRQAKKAIA